MCFETTKSAKAKIADKDIECWKVLSPNNSAPCYNYKYRKNRQTTRIPVKILIGDYQAIVTRGYHSYKSKDIARNSWLREYNSLIKKFIIPKGTRYYSNRIEYVSETIMLVE